jgi:hypothetical protein
LPQVCRSLREAFALPQLRAKCIEAMLALASAADAAVPSLSGSPVTWQQPASSAEVVAATVGLSPRADELLAVRTRLFRGSTPLSQQLAVRSTMLRLRGHVRVLAGRAIERHGLAVLKQCIGEFGLDLSRHQAECMRRCMRHDFADGVELLLRLPRLLLPALGTPPAMQQTLDRGIAVRPDWVGQTVLQLEEPPPFNPAFLGVLHQSVGATRALLHGLRGLQSVRVEAGGGDTRTMGGAEYATRLDLSKALRSHRAPWRMSLQVRAVGGGRRVSVLRLAGDAFLWLRHGDGPLVVLGAPRGAALHGVTPLTVALMHRCECRHRCRASWRDRDACAGRCCSWQCAAPTRSRIWCARECTRFLGTRVTPCPPGVF